MNILVTGTKGFIGKNLYDSILTTNNMVNQLDLEDFYLPTKDEWFKKLLSVIEEINPDVIFHVGACSDVLEKDVNYMMEVNFFSTKIMTDWCENNNKKMIYSSSSSVYGTNNEHPSNLYGWSKYVGECYVVSKGGISLRYFNVYGPHEEHKGKMSSIIYQMLKLKKENPEAIFKLYPVNASRDFVHVEDVVSANIHAMSNYDMLKGKYYEVGSGKSQSFEDILNKIGLKFILTPKEDVPNGYQTYTCSNSSLWMKDWYPKYQIELGITEYKKYLNY